MDKLELFPKLLKPYLHLLDEGHMATGYIVEGDEKVCVIDTMNGFTDIKSYIREFTDKPVVVVNTHGHPDHIFGDVYFDEAYLHPKDLALAESFLKVPEFVDACEKNGLVTITEFYYDILLLHVWEQYADEEDYPVGIEEKEA